MKLSHILELFDKVSKNHFYKNTQRNGEPLKEMGRLKISV
jgi:hypothetical protein